MPKVQTTLKKHWCFTLNNYTEDDVAAIRAIPSEYTCFGREVGESGTPHLQGYMSFNSRKRLTAVKKLIPRAHWEAAKGNPSQNRTYCSKDGAFEEQGNIPLTGGEKEQARWTTALNNLKAGNMDDVPADIQLRYYSTCKRILADHRPEPEEAPDVTGVWIYGPAGCGKSRYARDKYPGAYRKDVNKWWDGYTNQGAVIVEDMDPFHKALGRLFKIWCDRYPFPAEFKGGKFDIRPNVIVITSQYSIDQVWDDEETRAAMKRRCKVIYMPEMFSE